ncbi:MAG: nickel-dependent hydrogenase large subunit [Elusimicrobiaceae bacterium]|jgi:ech hydrogenase subunit E
MKKTILPLGPQHPVLPEPLSFDLVLENEKVIEAVPSIGYIHRGLELLAPKKEFTDYVYVAERICGICSFIHGLGYCQAVEQVMKTEVPERAQYLRVFWSELSRVHSHLLWLGLAADAFGFENLFMQTWRLREHVLGIFEKTTGGRVIFSVCKVGGVKKNISDEDLKAMVTGLETLAAEIKTTTDVFLNDYSAKQRLCGLGVLSKEDAWHLGAVGPVLRASGSSTDVRMTGYAKYGELDFAPVVETAGDCYARCKVRIREIFQSINLMRQVCGKIKGEAIEAKITGMPDGECFMRLEQPRGEVVYYVKGNGTKFLERFRVRTPTFANIPPAIVTLKGSQLADVPTLLLSIDPCISCTER